MKKKMIIKIPPSQSGMQEQKIEDILIYVDSYDLNVFFISIPSTDRIKQRILF